MLVKQKIAMEPEADAASACKKRHADLVLRSGQKGQEETEKGTHELCCWFPFLPHYQSWPNHAVLQWVPVEKVARARGIRCSTEVNHAFESRPPIRPIVRGWTRFPPRTGTVDLALESPANKLWFLRGLGFVNLGDHGWVGGSVILF